MKPAVLQHAWLVTWLLAALPLPVDRPGAGISPSVFAPLLHSHPRWSPVGTFSDAADGRGQFQQWTQRQ